MPTITINRIPAEASKGIKAHHKSRSGYARAALAEKLSRDGHADLAALLQKPAPPLPAIHMTTIPSPEMLRPLLESALAVMEPNDPAREHVSAFMGLPVDGRSFYCVHFCSYMENPIRNASGAGSTPQDALDKFKASYAPPVTKEGRIAALRAAALRAELAAMEGKD